MTLLKSKISISHHFRPRNGSETLERAASTSPSGNERPWEVLLALGQALRRVSRARVVVPPGVWSWVVTKYCRHLAYSYPKTHHREFGALLRANSCYLTNYQKHYFMLPILVL
jgi:hypothetical protein